ncbi:MAG TPA: Hint domain-containing protein [Paracoccaceae bacterium]|nr:Hint domain-containing protein [Paracoccaceae bacterium]
MATGAELLYNTGASAFTLADTIFGPDVQVIRASLGPSNSVNSGTYANGHLAPGVVPGPSGIILSTGDIRSFTQSGGDPNQAAGTSTDTNGTNNSAQFNALAGAPTFDAVWLDATFVPQGSVLTLDFVFSSEEYPEYVGSGFNDVVGVWVNGTLVPISLGNGQISVNNINQPNAQNLVVSNTGDQFNTEMDGFTVKLSLTAPVIPGQQNTIRIGIADTLDSVYDSNLLIAANAAKTNLVAMDDALQMGPGQTRTFNLLANDIKPAGATLVITHINNIAVTAGQTITLSTGQTITLNADGTITVGGDGQTETVSFTYEAAIGGGNGLSDVGMVTLNQVPCFVAGTRILTPGGEVAVEDLRPGDMVVTLDEGARPLRWVGSRTVAAEGAFAPIRIRAGTFGAHRDLRVSPQHRVLVRDVLADLMFGEPEVLVAAKDLVNGRSVRREAGGTVTYVHLLFDRHQVVMAEGLATESFLPGPAVARALAPETLREILVLFPELDPETGAGYGPAARRMLRAHEAAALTGRAA